MTSDETRLLIEQAVSAIGTPLYEGVATGFAQAQARLASLANLKDYPSIQPMLARCEMRNFWLANPLPGAWGVRGNPRLSGQTILANAESGLRLRLLKERSRTYPGGVPVAGSNSARQREWTQPRLGVSLPHGVIKEPARLLLLWDRLLDRSGDEAITVRVVHPLEPGVYGRSVPIDMDFKVEPDGGIFDALTFRGDPQPDDFFPTVALDEDPGAAASDH